jgi:TonB family protein
MKAVFIAAALPLLALAAPAAAEPAHVTRWIAETTQEIGASVPPAPGAGAVAIRASVGSSRRFEGVQLVGTSGSKAVDRAALEAARKHRSDPPPTELIGRSVMLRVAPANAALAHGGSAAAR